MSNPTQPITSWAEFQRLPERPEVGIRYELHDGEVVVVPPPAVARQTPDVNSASSTIASPARVAK